MAILSGYQKVKKYVKESSGFRLLSQLTMADTVHLKDNSTLQDLVDGLGGASQKNVDATIAASSASENLPTSKAVAAFVEGKGYSTTNGTITGIKMNGVSKGTSGEVDLGTVITAHQDISGKLDKILKGANNGLAELDANGKVPSSQLPSYVDDVIEGASASAFPTTGETGKIYVALDTNKTYRWSGSEYVVISETIALGETSSTAYRGDRGKAAYDHANETKLSTATASGLYKVAGTAKGHIASLTAVTKADITGLGIPAQDTTYSPFVKSGAGATAGLVPTPPTTAGITKFLREDGTWIAPPDNDTWTAFVGASASAAGTAGYVPAPGTGNQAKFFRGDGTWATPTNTWTAMKAATTDAAGGAGYVPAPAAGKQTSFLRGDATWVVPTDTKNTAGSTDSSSKLFLIGATSQAANPRTYSQDTAYVGTDGYLYSNSKKVIGVTEATGSLTANATSLVISDSAITTSSTIEVFSSVWGVNPTDMVIAAGKVTFTFPDTHVAATIKIRIS